jgi:predicted RNA binding protein YcfA (HicA-like mRNA interferase family)
MPEPRKVSGREAARALVRLGFRHVWQRGSHTILVWETAHGRVGCVVPMHRELKIGILKGVLRQAKVKPDDFTREL